MVPNELKAINELDLSLFFYSSLDFMCIACADGYFKKLNPTFLTESGYSEFELLSRPFISFFHPDDAQKTQDEAKKLSAGMLTVQFQNRFQCKDGSEKLLSWKCTPLGPLFFATGRDISASHQAELALKESESRIRLILANAPIALFTFEKSGLVTFSSGRALEKIGIQPEEIVGKNLFEFHKDRQDIVEIAKKSLKGLTATSTITLNNVILETSYAPIRNEFDEVTKVIGVSVDVTESRNAEVEVQEIKSKLIAQELEKKFRETFENAGVGIAHTTFEGKILLVNQELCDVLGYSETELQGINYFDIISEGDVATSEAIRSQMLSGQINKFVRERTLKRKNGAILCALVTVTAVRESNGMPKYFILAHKDINELKLIENSLRASE